MVTPEPTCRCGHNKPIIATRGPYTGLCDEGVEIKKEEIRVKQAEAFAARRARKRQGKEPAPNFLADSDGMRSDVFEGNRIKLSDTIKDVLVPAAKHLENSLENRAAANNAARVKVIEFNEALKVVQRVAQSLISISTRNRATTRDIE